jgi:hypothetical protein
MELGSFNFKNANDLDWSNPYLDVIIAMRLLLFTYETRSEAEPFRVRRREIKQKCSEGIDNLPELVETFRNAFPLGPFGVTREETGKTITDFSARLFPAAIQAAQTLMNGTDTTTSEDVVSNHYVQSLMELVNRNIGNQEQNGGVLKLGWKPSLNDLEKDQCLREMLEVFMDPRALRLLEYHKELVHLYYECGLKCWWAPSLYFVDDLARWAGPVPAEHLAAPTLDGMLLTCPPKRSPVIMLILKGHEGGTNGQKELQSGTDNQ